MQNQGKDPGVITYTNTGTAISAGDIINLGHRVGVALVDIAATTGTGSVAVQGIFYLAKDTSVISLENELHWSVSGENATTTPAASDPRLGIATEAAATGKAYVNVQINAPRTVGDATIDSGAGDASGNQAAIVAIIAELQQAGIAAVR